MTRGTDGRDIAGQFKKQSNLVGILPVMNMTTYRIDLPQHLLEFVESQVSSLGFADPSAYVQWLLRNKIAAEHYQYTEIRPDVEVVDGRARSNTNE